MYTIVFHAWFSPHNSDTQDFHQGDVSSYKGLSAYKRSEESIEYNNAYNWHDLGKKCVPNPCYYLFNRVNTILIRFTRVFHFNFTRSLRIFPLLAVPISVRAPVTCYCPRCYCLHHISHQIIMISFIPHHIVSLPIVPIAMRCSQRMIAGLAEMVTSLLI